MITTIYVTYIQKSLRQRVLSSFRDCMERKGGQHTGLSGGKIISLALNPHLVLFFPIYLNASFFFLVSKVNPCLESTQPFSSSHWPIISASSLNEIQVGVGGRVD